MICSGSTQAAVTEWRVESQAPSHLRASTPETTQCRKRKRSGLSHQLHLYQAKLCLEKQMSLFCEPPFFLICQLGRMTPHLPTQYPLPGCYPQLARGLLPAFRDIVYLWSYTLTLSPLIFLTPSHLQGAGSWELVSCTRLWPHFS